MTRSILIYANCQGEELKVTGQYMQCLTGHLTFKWIPLHLVNDADWETTYDEAFFADVATVWEQVETGAPTPHRERLHARIPPGCPVIRFPPYSAIFLWPFSGNDPRLAADPQRYPWPDSVAALLANESLPDDALFDRYMQMTAERMPDLDRRLRMDTARWRASDAIADVPLAAWVEAHVRTTSLFHTSGHITAPAIGYLMKQLLARTPALTGHLTRAAPAEVDLLMRFHAGQDFETVPIHPTVAERLDLKFYDPNATWRWHSHRWTFRQYILHYIRWAPYIR
jgi:hypothetical protein